MSIVRAFAALIALVLLFVAMVFAIATFLFREPAHWLASVADDVMKWGVK